MHGREKIITFQIGSLGDTIVSMPAHREIRRRHPNADSFVLTNFPIGQKMVSADALLRPLGLTSGAIEYPMPLRGLNNIRKLYRTIVQLRPSHLYYLTPETKILNLVRHYVFFRLCGIRNIHGMPWSRDLRFPRKLESGTTWESEASRLLRSIGAQDHPGPPPEADRQLDLSEEERNTAASVLRESSVTRRFVAVSVGGKVPINNWGDQNWQHFLAALSNRFPELGLVLVGSADERSRNDALAGAWQGVSFNSCGLFSPRETAAVLEQACVFVGHDTGTLHLAAAAGTKVIGIFSARNVPGKWFSDRASDTFLFKTVACMGCELVQVEDCPHSRKCIMSITPDEALAAATKALSASSSIAGGPASTDPC